MFYILSSLGEYKYVYKYPPYTIYMNNNKYYYNLCKNVYNDIYMIS